MPPQRRLSPDASDHDLLIRLDTKVDILIGSQGEMRNALDARINETRTALGARIENLGKDKANISDLDPLRKQIERIQEDVVTHLADKLDNTRRLVFIGVGILAALQAIT